MLCADCAAIHQNFGNDVSVVRPLLGVDWVYEDYQYLRLGGNTNFRNFLASYSLDLEATADKYFSKAAAYYRARVYSPPTSNSSSRSSRASLCP